MNLGLGSARPSPMALRHLFGYPQLLCGSKQWSDEEQLQIKNKHTVYPDELFLNPISFQLGLPRRSSVRLRVDGSQQLLLLTLMPKNALSIPVPCFQSRRKMHFSLGNSQSSLSS